MIHSSVREVSPGRLEPHHMSPGALLHLISLALAVALPTAGEAAAEGRWHWQDVSRVVAVGDLHGSADKAIRLLNGTGLVDGNLHWIGGTDHLVVAGDFIDRGTGDRPLWIYCDDSSKRAQRRAGVSTSCSATTR